MPDSNSHTIDTFPLSWRWTQDSHTVLPTDILATIQPLSANEADALTGRARAIWALGAAPSTLGFDAPAEDSAAIRHQLAALGIPGTTSIVVYWSTGLAVRTLWSTFHTFWDDFCYPASDDVVVWPDLGTWALRYGHEEWFSFSRAAVV